MEREKPPKPSGGSLEFRVEREKPSKLKTLNSKLKLRREQMFSFEKLDVWKKSVDLCEELLILADRVGQSDRYSLGEQLRRAAISVSNNIAEGGGRNYKKEKVYFYNIARGSIYEIVNLLEICKRRKHLDAVGHVDLYQKAEEIAKMLSGLIGSS